MKVWASVNEADIGRIHKDMPVTFTVDTYPNEIFHGTVYQTRMNATMTQSVVTYTVEVKTDNSDLRLLPYLTANVSFQVEKRDNVLKVPNGALRWKPPRAEMVAPEYRDMLAPAVKEKVAASQSTAAKSPGETAKKGDAAEAKTPVDPKVANSLKKRAKQLAAEKPAKDASAPKAPEVPKTPDAPAKAATHVDHGTIWVKDGVLAKPVKVRIGITDGIETEVSGKDLDKDMEVIIGEATPDQTGDVSNLLGPPKFFNKAGGPPKTRP
jgi:HlyD family secretion protein